MPGRLRAYDGCMQYAPRGGYTPAKQQQHERLRLNLVDARFSLCILF